jgi:hypothetical protein
MDGRNDVPEAAYKYGDGDRETFREDLKTLARAGYQVYDGVINQLAGGTAAGAKALRKRMRTPGFVQIASKRGPTHVLPAAMIYDHNLDSQADLTICKDFLDALDDQQPSSSTGARLRNSSPKWQCSL